MNCIIDSEVVVKLHSQLLSNDRNYCIVFLVQSSYYMIFLILLSLDIDCHLRNRQIILLFYEDR